MPDTPTPTLAARVAGAREALAEYDAVWCPECSFERHGADTPHGGEGYPVDFMARHLRAALDALDEVERERDRLRALLRGLLDYEAEGARYRLFSGCTCLGRSKHNEQLYEAGKCPHQLAEAALGHGGGGRA